MKPLIIWGPRIKNSCRILRFQLLVRWNGHESKYQILEPSNSEVADPKLVKHVEDRVEFLLFQGGTLPYGFLVDIFWLKCHKTLTAECENVVFFGVIHAGPLFQRWSSRGQFFNEPGPVFQDPGPPFKTPGPLLIIRGHLQSIRANFFCFAIAFQFLRDFLYKINRGQFLLFCNNFSIS